MKQYYAYPMWSNPRYRVVSFLSLLFTSFYFLVWLFNISGYNTSLPAIWLVVSIPLLASLFWNQTLTIGEATFFYTEHFFGFTVAEIKSADLAKVQTIEEKKWHYLVFTDKNVRIETDFYHNRKQIPMQRSPFGHEGLVLHQGQ